MTSNKSKQVEEEDTELADTILKRIRKCCQKMMQAFVTFCLIFNLIYKTMVAPGNKHFEMHHVRKDFYKDIDCKSTDYVFGELIG